MNSDHVHEFTLPCFVCNDEPNTLCACGECVHCGPPVKLSEIADATRRFDIERRPKAAGVTRQRGYHRRVL
jgi:hypothetical protein